MRSDRLRRWWARLAPVALVTGCWAAGVYGQSMRPLPGQGVRASSSSHVGALVVAGVVYDVESAQPLGSAQVHITGTQAGGLTTSDGRFEFRVTRPGRYELRVEKIGFATQSDSIRVSDAAGTLVYVGTRSRSFEVCDQLCVGPCPTGTRFVLEVRSVLTGEPVTTSIDVAIRHSSGLEAIGSYDVDARSAYATVYLGDSVQLPGPYDVTVSTPDHELWRTEDVWLEWGCPEWTAPLLPVWLLPEPEHRPWP